MVAVPLTPAQFVEHLHTDDWASTQDDPMDALDYLALDGELILAPFFVAAGALIRLDDEETLARFGAGVFQT